MATEISTRDAFLRVWQSPPGFLGFFQIVQHKNVGMRYMITAFVLFLIGGVESLLLRVQLARPDNDFLDSQTYNELFTMHGSTMMFLFAIPFLEGLASYLLPLLLGARDLPFPRFNAFNYWCYLFGGLILYSSFLFALVPDTGWFAYVPLSRQFADQSMDFWLLGLTLAEIAAVGAAVEIGVSVLCMRAPGMSLNRMPVFAWTMLAIAAMIIIAFIPLVVATLLLELDRTIGTAFFDESIGGSPLLWQHLFWIFGHPEVYVLFLPGAAIVSQVLPVHSQRRLAGYPLVVIAVIVTAVMSIGLWVHHMYTVGLPSITLAFFTASSMAITLASGIQVFAWLTTLWLGKPRFTVPLLYCLGFIVTFVAGGITGVMVASTPVDQQVHDTYFVVAHFHYVVLGGMLFPIFAAIYHWWPKVTGRLYSYAPGVVGFALIFVGFHTTFFPMHLIGLWGLPRRVYTYSDDLGLAAANLTSTIGAFILAAGILVLIVNLSLSRLRGAAAPDDPWGGDTLEWTIPSPPGDEDFGLIPVVASRTPAWDDEDGEDRDPKYDTVSRAYAYAPTGQRVTPMTTTIAADPDSALLTPGPTAWPMLPAAGLLVVGIALLTGWSPLVFVGIAAALVGFGGWAWSNEARERRSLEPVDGVYPFEASGRRAIGWWAATSTLICIIVGMATLAFSALFLQVNSPVWPFTHLLGRPLLSIIVLLALVAATVAGRWGGRARADGGPERTRHLTAIALSAAAGILALVLLIVIWTTSGLDPTADAYQSSAWVLVGATAFLAMAGLAVTAVALLGRLVHSRDSRGRILVDYAGILWGAVAVAWAISWITTDLLPLAVI